MTTQNIIQKINLEQANLLKQINERDNSDLSIFLNHFISECDIEDITKINLTDLATAYLLTKTTLSFEEIKHVIEAVEPLFQYLSAFSFNHYIEYMNHYLDDLEIEKKKTDSFHVKLEKFSLRHIRKKVNISIIMDFLKKENEAMLSCCNLIGYIKTIKEKTEKMNRKGKNIDIESIKYQKYNGGYYTIESCLEALKMIKGNCEYMISSIKKEGRGDNRELRRYLKIKEWLLQNQEKREIVDLPQQLLKMSNQELKIEILKEIYEHNNKYYDEVENQKQKLEKKKKNIYPYQLLFKEHNLDISQIDHYLDYDLSRLTIMIKSLKELGITNSEQLLSIISNSNFETITEISILSERQFISKNFIAENLEIFTSSYEDLVKNIALLQEKGIAISTILKMEDSLLEENQKLEEKIKTLESYNLLTSFKNSTSFDFMKSDYIEVLIDQIIELGFEQALEQDLDLLNIDPVLLKRVVILKRLNIPIESKEELLDILSSSKFSIPSSNLDSYIFDMTPYIEDDLSEIEITKEEVKEQLKTHQKTPYSYDFNGEIISINKISRNLDSIKKDTINGNELFQCMISNKVLDHDDYHKVRNFITSQKHVLKK